MSIAAALATTHEVLNFANELKKLAPSERKRVRPLLNALQALYFTPGGILMILRGIATGQAPTIVDIQAAVLEFNEGEWNVQNAVRDLDFGALERFDIPLRYRTSLQAAAYGKASLRRDLQNIINTPTGRLPLDSIEAKQLVERIEELNCAIETLDEALRG